MKIFAEQDLRAFLDGRMQQAGNEIRSVEPNYLLNVNETQFIRHLVSRYQLEPLDFDFDGVTVSQREELVLAERFPNAFDFRVTRGRRYPKQVITYHLPYRGNGNLLRYTPSCRILWTTEVQVQSDAVCFDIVNWRDDPTSIKREADDVLQSIRTQAANVSSEVASFNGRLEPEMTRLVQVRKAELLKQGKLLGALGVPVRKAAQVPSTFAVPVERKPVLIERPPAPAGSFAPEPTLGQEVYEGILRIIRDTGQEMERHPSIYGGKDEETLRDHFLMVLAPHFQSTTGETFNRCGKTDILIRHERQNVFIAECKFWSGPKAHHRTIDQLLSYLTWRDSKAAVVCFVRNKELGPVLTAIEQETPKHPCFVQDQGKKEEGWFRYEFHLSGDPTRAVHVAVLVFHLP